jgi:hypothetical protein
MAGLGVTAMLTMLSSGAVFTAQRLGQSLALPLARAGREVNDCPVDTICYPAEIGWYALTALAGFGVLIVSALLRLLLLRLVRWQKKTPDLCTEYDEDANEGFPPRTYDIEGTCSGEGHDDRRLAFAKTGVDARWLANVTDDADWLIGAGVMTTLTLIVSAAVARLFFDLLPDERETAVFGFASWAVAFVVIAGAFLVYRSRESRQLRETLGILWDVMSFFPRRFHPLAPPCYAERAVIDVRNRVIHTTTRGMGSDETDSSNLILVAHSEGTLISTAALLSLLPDRHSHSTDVEPIPGHPEPTGRELERVRFVTYGCMLARLYSRAWPDQLPESTLIDLKLALEGPDARVHGPDIFPCPPANKLPRWINFGRYSDYLGGRVFQELQRKPTKELPGPEGDHRCDDIFFVDPTRRWRWDGQLVHARIWRHSFDYESDAEDPQFREHIWATARVLNGESEADIVAEYAWSPACIHHP